ncbi:hypothetical protein AK88_05082 [Plasmodium fragile]|uniref:Uncharacterized protein n=1 Tax=Plasmodium fragile TaxID=5857 RepID=A0A0D9QE15_PLAFR|nr:uncharacterized protein AK88_05082 [Plasmodium fragile]KJP85300.1 hypothetical protein AK88_05082 [Plasmodium fragile]
MTRYNSCSDFQYISENVMCLLQGSCICLLNLVNNERKFLFISCCETLGEVRFELAAGQGRKSANVAMGRLTTRVAVKGETDHCTHNVEGRYIPHPVRKISCSEKDHAMAVVIRRPSGDLLFYLVFDEANGLNSCEVQLTHRVGETIKDVTLGDGQVYLLLKRRHARPPLQEGELSGRDNTRKLSDQLGADLPFDEEYLICTLKLSRNKKEDLEIIATHKSSSIFKKMMVCPYDGKKIILVSQKSVFFVSTSNEHLLKENVTTVKKELFVNSPIVATSWLDFHIFTICLSNNEVLFFNLSTNSRDLPRLRCHNNYSKICCIFYHLEYLFVAFATKEIVCFRVNYGALSPAAFRKVTPVEDNYVTTKCLFQKRKENRKAEEKPSMEAPPNEPNTQQAKENEALNNRRHIRRKSSKQSGTTFESILNEIKNVENKINDKGFELLDESEGEGRVDDEQAWDSVAFAECVAQCSAGCASSMDTYPSSKDDYANLCSPGEDNIMNKGTPSKRAHRKHDLSQMRKKRKANFAKLHYDEDNLTHIFTPISVVNFEKYVTHRIISVHLHRGKNLLIQLENGLSYYTTTFNRKKMSPADDSSFYLCGHTALHKIKDLKVCSRKYLFTLDEAKMLKCYSLADNELNVICTGGGIKWFDVLSLMGEYNCLFVALTDGSFFFINLISSKILLYGSVRRHLGDETTRGRRGPSVGRSGRRCIECGVFNKVNEHIFNGYFKVCGTLLFFFLIHSVSHQKLFIYFVHEVLIGRLLAQVCHQGGSDESVCPNVTQNVDQNVNQSGEAATLLLSLSTYRRSDVDVHVDLEFRSKRHCDYACLLTATEDLRNFYLLFVQLIKKEMIIRTKKNWDTNVRIFYWKVPHKNVVYAKVIGNYLVLVDFHLNVRFFYMNRVTFGDVSPGNSNEVAALLSGKKTSFLRRLKRDKGSTRREGVHGPNDEGNDFEEFILKRRRRRQKPFRPDGVNEDSETLNREPHGQPNGEEKSVGSPPFRINLGEEDLHIDLSHTGRVQFINEQMEQNAGPICAFYIVTDSNTVVTFSFDSSAYPLRMVLNPEVQVPSMRGTERINFFHPVDMKSGTYNLFLTKERHFRLEGVSCAPAMVPSGDQVGGDHERGKPHEDNHVGGDKPTNQSEHLNWESSLDLICQKDMDSTMQATLAKISQGTLYPSDVNFFLRQPSVVFLKVYSSALRKRLRDKRGKSFQERVSMEWGTHPSGATKEVPAGDDKVTSSGAAISADAATPIAFSGTPNHTNFFFDNETTIFTFLNENEYHLPLQECLENYKNKFYLSELHAKRKEEREQIDKLRNQLKELITQNENNNSSIKLDRKNFFFDKKIINESEILINEFEKIKKKFEKKKIAKEQLIKKLEKKCSPLAQIDFLFGLNTNSYVTNSFKKSSHHHSCPIREKIKLLRFLQLKESDFVQNVEKNNVLCFLKTTKDYIDRYTEDFSCLFFSHYYPCTNMNLNYLYANLFGSSFSAGGVDSGVDGVQWNYLLYPPCELFTNARKRLQCYVLQMLIDQQKAKFLSHFLALKEEKQNYVEEINLLSNKLKLSLESTDKYFSHPYSHTIEDGLYNRGALKGVKRDALLPVSNKFDPHVLLKMHLHKLNVESQKGDAFDDHEKGDLTLKREKKGDHFGMAPGLRGSEAGADKEPPKDTTPCNDEADPESVEIKEKKKNDVRNALSDVKSYIYQISDQCEEFNEKLKQLRKKKYNIQKLIKLHELYCIGIYATLINEERKEEALRQIEEKRIAVEGELSKLEDSMRQLDALQKHKKNLALSELLTRKKQKFEKRFLHECINFDVLIEQKYENVIGFDFDSRKNLFIKKKIIQKHITDTNQIIHENFELRKSIRKLKHDICRNKIKKDYLHFSLMDIEEGVDDVKYLKQNCEFLFSDINNVISSLEAKKKNRKLIFQISEQKLREQISNVDAKISAMKSENVVLEANMQSLLKEISQMDKAAQGDQEEDATHLLDTKGNLGDDDVARVSMFFKCSDAVVAGEIGEENETDDAPHVEGGSNQQNETDNVVEQSRDHAHKQAADQDAAPEKKKQKKLRTKDIHERSAMLRKKYK